MRTNITHDDDIIETAHYLAKQNKTKPNQTSLGKVISDLARKGLQEHKAFQLKNDFPVFEVSENSPVITPEHVKQLEDEV